MKKFFLFLLKSLSLFFLLFAFLFFLPITIFAETILFEDDFNNPVHSATKWIVIGPQLYNGDGTEANWRFENGMYGISIINRGDQFNETVPADSEWNNSWRDYIFEVDFKRVWGADTNLVFRYVDHNKWYGIHGIHDELKIHLQKVGWVPWTNTPQARTFFYLRNVWYKIRVEVQNGNIKISIKNKETGEDTLLWDFYDSAVISSYGKPGLQASTGTVTNSEVWFDNVKVTAIEEEKEPLILLPGLGGSWNHEEIFAGIDRPQSAWYKTPFIENYNGLIQTLQNAGYILNEDLFIFYYDWLQPIAQSATDLKNYIDNVVDPPLGTKVDLIGHSLGGLVGRTYIQNNPGSHQVDQLITLGSPHKGVPQVYKAWEGADLNELLGNKERIGAGILLRLHGFGYSNLVQAIQNLVPSLGNLLFIDDYLKWNNGAIKPEPSMSQQNTWLKGLGTSSELLGLTDTVVGTAGDTPRWLKIIPRSHSDEELGQWEDGKPIGEESAIGDRTILEESAKLEEANIVILDGLDHSELVQSVAGIVKILELLGVSDGVEIVEQPTIPFEPALVFTIASPVTLRVTDPLGRPIGAGIDLTEIPDATFSAQEKIIIIPHAINGKYKVEVINDNNGGSYQFLIGQLTQKQDLWSVYQNAVTPGKPDNYSLTFDNTLQTTDTYLASLVNSKLKTLLTQIQRQNINFRIKIRLTLKVRSIPGQTKPLLSLLEQQRDKLATRYLQKAIFETTKAIDYAEEFYPDVLPSLREILDLLGQLHQLLEN